MSQFLKAHLYAHRRALRRLLQKYLESGSELEGFYDSNLDDAVIEARLVLERESAATTEYELATKAAKAAVRYLRTLDDPPEKLKRRLDAYEQFMKGQGVTF